jgi:hypothetical protein
MRVTAPTAVTERIIKKCERSVNGIYAPLWKGILNDKTVIGG